MANASIFAIMHSRGMQSFGSSSDAACSTMTTWGCVLTSVPARRTDAMVKAVPSARDREGGLGCAFGTKSSQRLVTAESRADARERFAAVVGQPSTDTAGPHRLCAACLAALPVRRIGVTITLPDGGHEYLTASDEIAQDMEFAQITFGEGPGIEAIASGGPVVVRDIDEVQNRWPLFTQEAVARGAGPMYAMPLQLGAIRVGWLTLYPYPGQPLNNQDFEDALAIADMLTSVLLAAGRDGTVDLLDPWWAQPSNSREIHQATGMLVARLNMTARDAYVRLRAYAFSTGRRLDEVARDIVHHGLRIDSDTPGDETRPGRANYPR